MHVFLIKATKTHIVILRNKQQTFPQVLNDRCTTCMLCEFQTEQLKMNKPKWQDTENYHREVIPIDLTMGSRQQEWSLQATLNLTELSCNQEYKHHDGTSSLLTEPSLNPALGSSATRNPFLSYFLHILIRPLTTLISKLSLSSSSSNCSSWSYPYQTTCNVCPPAVWPSIGTGATVSTKLLQLHSILFPRMADSCSAGCSPAELSVDKALYMFQKSN